MTDEVMKTESNTQPAQPVEAVDVVLAHMRSVRAIRLGLDSLDSSESHDFEVGLHAALAHPRPTGDDAADKAERMLSELVDKIMPGLDTGDLLADAVTASRYLDVISKAICDLLFKMEISGVNWRSKDLSLCAAFDALASRIKERGHE